MLLDRPLLRGSIVSIIALLGSTCLLCPWKSVAVATVETNVVSADGGKDDPKPEKGKPPLTLLVPSRLATDLTEFLRDLVPEKVEIRVRRATPRWDPSPMSRVELIAKPEFPEFNEAIRQLVQVCIDPFPSSYNQLLDDNLAAFVEVSGAEMPKAKPVTPTAKAISKKYKLTPKRARLVQELLSKHRKVPLKVKARLGVLEVTGSEPTLNLIEPILEVLGAEDVD